MATTNKFSVETALKTYQLDGVQLAYSTDKTRINYVFYNGNVYSIARMSSAETLQFFRELHCNGVCEWADRPRRMKKELKSFLETIGEYNNVMGAVQDKAREQAVKEQSIEWKNYSQKAVDNAVATATIDELEVGLEMRKPSKIVVDRLVELSEPIDENDNSRYVEPLGKLVYWYYTNYDATRMETIKDCKSINWSNVCDKFVKINNCYTSIAVMREVMQAYADFYKINHKVDMADVIKMSKMLEQVGVGA